MSYLRCWKCGKRVSSILFASTTVRGTIECPECTEKEDSDRLKVWSVIHSGYNPVGACSVVVAKDRRTARRLVVQELESRNLPTKHLKFTEIDLQSAKALILLDGDY